jgi:hypothetical protein
VSDKFRIKIPLSVDVEMSAWNIPDGVRTLVEDQLRNRLAPDPVNQLFRVEGPDGDPLNIFEFLIPDGSSTYVFMFHFLYGQDENSLNLIACDYERFDSDSDDSSTPVM